LVEAGIDSSSDEYVQMGEATPAGEVERKSERKSHAKGESIQEPSQSALNAPLIPPSTDQ
jgi:hypothetical protein